MSAENKINTSFRVSQCRVISCWGVIYKKNSVWWCSQAFITLSDWQMTGLLKSEINQDELYFHPETTNPLLSLLPSLQWTHRLWHNAERKIPAGMLLMLIKVTALFLSSSLRADALFTYIFCSAYARIHSHLWLTNFGPIKGGHLIYNTTSYSS